jgi:3-phenylpropionate/trans-cinnamate dioxygenase ferredoxin subunit
MVARLKDLPPTGLLGVTLANGDRVCVVSDRGEIRAVSNVCTHQEFPMSEGTLLSNGRIECAWHGAQFDCRTGAPKHYPAEEPLPVYDVKVEDGAIWVRGRGR